MKNIFTRFIIAFLLVLPINVCISYDKNGKETYWSAKTIEIPEDYIFGYGSLVNSNSRETYIGYDVPAIPARISHKFGYFRTWSFKSSTTFIALGITKSEGVSNTGATINGVIYAVPNNNSMEMFDARESGYTRVKVPWDMVEPVGWQKLPKAGNLWIYVPNEDFASPPNMEYPILQSYVDTCLLGFMEYGEEYAQEFLETTYGWSSSWIDDRMLERRPWVHQQKSSLIDKMLKTFLSKEESAFFINRSKPVFSNSCSRTEPGDKEALRVIEAG